MVVIKFGIFKFLNLSQKHITFCLISREVFQSIKSLRVDFMFEAWHIWGMTPSVLLEECSILVRGRLKALSPSQDLRKDISLLGRLFVVVLTDCIWGWNALFFRRFFTRKWKRCDSDTVIRTNYLYIRYTQIYTLPLPRKTKRWSPRERVWNLVSKMC